MIKSLGTAEIDVFGARVTVRAPSAAEHAAIIAQAPDPPLLRGDGGALDPQHPTTMRLRARADTLRSALLVGAATAHTHPTLGPWRADMSSKDAAAYADDVLASASPHALQAIEAALGLLSMGIDPSAKRDEVDRIGTDTTPGNSLGPSRTPSAARADVRGADGSSLVDHTA
jgi:hypothetical protein